MKSPLKLSPVRIALMISGVGLFTISAVWLLPRKANSDISPEAPADVSTQAPTDANPRIFVRVDRSIVLKNPTPRSSADAEASLEVVAPFVRDVYGAVPLHPDLVLHDPSAEDDFLFTQLVQKVETEYGTRFRSEIFETRQTVSDIERRLNAAEP